LEVVQTKQAQNCFFQKKQQPLTKMAGTTIDDIDYSDIEERQVKPSTIARGPPHNEMHPGTEFNTTMASTTP